MLSVDTMHLRTSRVTRNGKTYEYHQLVESYRRESDGMPATRVLASLGQLSAVELDNIKLAISASRDGKRLALPLRLRAAAAVIVLGVVTRRQVPLVRTPPAAYAELLAAP